MVEVLNKKIKNHDLNTKDIEKKFYKEQQIDMKQFVAQFMKERKEYHKFQIYKMKVGQ